MTTKYVVTLSTEGANRELASGVDLDVAIKIARQHGAICPRGRETEQPLDIRGKRRQNVAIWIERQAETNYWPRP